jgi:hypothetical protein
MNRLFKLPVLIGSLLLATTAEAADSAYIGHYQSTPADVAAIEQLTQDFRAALVAKCAAAVDVGIRLQHSVRFAREPERG